MSEVKRKRITTHPDRERRRKEAGLRNLARAGRSDAEQLALLEQRGHGHCKEARYLRTLLMGPLS